MDGGRSAPKADVWLVRSLQTKLRIAKHGQTDLDLGIGQPIDRGKVIGPKSPGFGSS